MEATSEHRKAVRRTSSPRPATAAAPARRPRRRMAAEDREEAILREATVYFAEHGLSAGTTELARRIGITQPLLYKYFDTKDALIERIYERLIPKNWNPSWELLIDQDDLPLRERLKRFYVEYATTVLTYEHVRLFLFSGLSRNNFNARYYGVLSQRILERIARALRREYCPSTRSRKVTKAELELAQSLHAAIYHLAFRRWVHGEPLGDELVSLVGRKVDFYLDGAAKTLSPAPRARARAPQPA